MSLELKKELYEKSILKWKAIKEVMNFLIQKECSKCSFCLNIFNRVNHKSCLINQTICCCNLLDNEHLDNSLYDKFDISLREANSNLDKLLNSLYDEYNKLNKSEVNVNGTN